MNGQEMVLAALRISPQTTEELAVVCGYEADDPRGRTYVSSAVDRLRRRYGCRIVNANERGSRYGATYVLVYEPEQVDSRGGRDHCLRCGSRLNRWNREGVCWPCQRSLALCQERAEVMAS